MLSIFSQLGLPLKSSPSHQTVPASSASFSVCDIGGSDLRSSGRMRSVINERRSDSTLSGTTTASVSSQPNSNNGTLTRPKSVAITIMATTVALHFHIATRAIASAQITATATNTQNIVMIAIPSSFFDHTC